MSVYTNFYKRWPDASQSVNCFHPCGFIGPQTQNPQPNIANKVEIAQHFQKCCHRQSPRCIGRTLWVECVLPPSAAIFQHVEFKSRYKRFWPGAKFQWGPKTDTATFTIEKILFLSILTRSPGQCARTVRSCRVATPSVFKQVIVLPDGLEYSDYVDRISNVCKPILLKRFLNHL